MPIVSLLLGSKGEFRGVDVGDAPVFMSEPQPQGKLHVSREVLLVHDDYAEIGAGKTGVWTLVHWGIERIERLSPELQVYAFSDSEGFEQGHVDLRNPVIAKVRKPGGGGA